MRAVTPTRNARWRLDRTLLAVVKDLVRLEANNGAGGTNRGRKRRGGHAIRQVRYRPRGRATAAPRLRAMIERLRSVLHRHGTPLGPSPMASSFTTATESIEPGAEVYRSVRIADRVDVTFALNPASEDPVAALLLNGDTFSDTPLVLMLDTVAAGDRVIDIGAHVGTYALSAATVGCRVLAIEAGAPNVQLLRAAVARSGVDVDVVHAVAAAREGRAAFTPRGPFGHVTIPARYTGGDLPHHEMAAVTVDAELRRLGWSGAELVKIDIEGGEVAALAGASDLLRRDDAPSVIFESNDDMLRKYGSSSVSLRRLLERLGFRLFLLDRVPGRRLVPWKSSDLQLDLVVDYFATKRPPSSLPWPVEPYSRGELIDRFLIPCAVDHAPYRVHAALTLRRAPRWVRYDPRVRSALRALRGDPAPEVRTAVAWFTRDESIQRARARLRPLAAALRRARR